MKKKNFEKKLVINKETIANLNNVQMGEIKGGSRMPCPTITCYTVCTCVTACIGTCGETCGCQQTITCPEQTCGTCAC